MSKIKFAGNAKMIAEPQPLDRTLIQSNPFSELFQNRSGIVNKKRYSNFDYDVLICHLHSKFSISLFLFWEKKRGEKIWPAESEFAHSICPQSLGSYSDETQQAEHLTHPASLGDGGVRQTHADNFRIFFWFLHIVALGLHTTLQQLYVRRWKMIIEKNCSIIISLANVSSKYIYAGRFHQDKKAPQPLFPEFCSISELLQH